MPYSAGKTGHGPIYAPTDKLVLVIAYSILPSRNLGHLLTANETKALESENDKLLFVELHRISWSHETKFSCHE